MEKKEILLSYKESEHKSLIRSAEIGLEKTQELIDKLKDRTGIEFTPGLFDVLLKNSDQKPIVTAITAVVEKQLTEANIKIPSIKDGAIKAEIEYFYQKYNDFISSRDPNKWSGFINELSIAGGVVSISADFEAKTKDQFCYKITTPEGIECYEKFLKAVELMNEGLTAVNPYYLIHAGGIVRWDMQAKTFTVNTDAISFDVVTQEPKKFF